MRYLILLVLIYCVLVSCKKAAEPVTPKTNCQLVKYSSLATGFLVPYIGTRFKTWYDVTYDKNGRKDKINVTRDGEQKPFSFFTYEYTDSLIIMKSTLVSTTIPETITIYKLNKRGFVEIETEITRGDTNMINKYEYNLDGYISKLTEIDKNQLKTVGVFNYQPDGSLTVNFSSGKVAVYNFYENIPDIGNNLSWRISN